MRISVVLFPSRQVVVCTLWHEQCVRSTCHKRILSMGDNTQLWPWLARLCWMVMLSLTLVYIFHSAPRATPYLAPPQGLAFCLYCGYGLMWHIFLMTVAFPVAMVEGYLALTSHVPRFTTPRPELCIESLLERIK